MSRNIAKQAAIACSRFAMGARPGDIEAATFDPQQWLKAQMTPPLFDKTLPNSSEALVLHQQFRQLKKQLDQQMEQSPPVINEANYKKQLRKIRPQKYVIAHTNDSLLRSIDADNSLAWRLLDFFSNHFSVTTGNRLMNFLAPTLEREAIAPYLFGQFEEMLLAVETHPAMIIYLNNERSFGPNSKLAKRSSERGLNENLAREILELHTLGVNGGYDQQDVIELAKAISGWSISRKKEKSSAQGFVYRSRGHEPGPRKILGKSYANHGVEQGRTILRQLAIHPSTAQFICMKLVRHFVSDKPPKKIVEAMTKRWLETKGNLRRVIETLIESEDAWHEKQNKYKTPREFVISAGRAAPPIKWRPRHAINSLLELGQRPFSAGSPAGFGDSNADWDGADALRARIEWSSQYSRLLRVDALTMARESLGKLVQKNTINVLSRAESQQQARALLLMSPEFQRR